MACGKILRRSQRDSRWSTRRKARRHEKLQKLCSGERAASGEALVTARPRAAKFFAGLRPCDSPRSWHWSADSGRAPLGGAGAPAARLLAAVASTLIAGAIRVDWPATATTGGPPADRLRCNIARADAVGWKGPLAPLQQAETLSATRWGLPGRRTGIFWRWAQGRYCSRRSSLGAKRQLRTEASFCAAASCRRILRSNRTLYRRHHERATAGRRLAPSSPRSTRRATGPLKAQNWYPHSPLLTVVWPIFWAPGTWPSTWMGIPGNSFSSSVTSAALSGVCLSTKAIE